MRTSTLRRLSEALVLSAITLAGGCGAPEYTDSESAASPFGVATQALLPAVNHNGTWQWLGAPSNSTDLNTGDPAHLGFSMICLDGTPSGFGINIPANWNNKVLFYLQGGGLCYDAASCALGNTGNPSVASQHFQANEFQNEMEVLHVSGTRLPNAPAVDINWDPAAILAGNAAFQWSLSNGHRGIFDRAASNPFSQYAFVFVPYCTGDFHAGTRIDNSSAIAGRTPSNKWHWGLYDAYYAFVAAVQILPTARNFVLAGSSAGGFGTYYTYRWLRNYVPSNSTVVTIADGAAPFWSGPNLPTGTPWGAEKGYLGVTGKAPANASFVEPLLWDAWGLSNTIEPAALRTTRDGKQMVALRDLWAQNAKLAKSLGAHDKFAAFIGQDDYVIPAVFPLNPLAGADPNIDHGLINAANYAASSLNTATGTTSVIKAVTSAQRPHNSASCSCTTVFCTQNCPLRIWREHHTFFQDDVSEWDATTTGGNGLRDFFTTLALP